VVKRIEADILAGRIRTGERLPAERELKRRLNTSRSALREALRVLEHKGLIEMRLGKAGGAYVRRVGATQLSRNHVQRFNHFQ
jgi:DNA-binding FadR family transcriptional regulator